jgi:hypothetical protein
MREAVARFAAQWAEVGLANIEQVYPNDLRHTMRDADDRPLPQEVHPAFYGSFDWHSCVEMHWMLVRLLRVAPSALGATADSVRAGLSAHLRDDALAREADYFTQRPSWGGRPYGWGWALTLAHELQTWDDADAARWSVAMRPLASVWVTRFSDWLPKAEFPVRHGVHQNSAFGLSRALGYARSAAPELVALIESTARRWFMDDVAYPAHYEPSGADFLSPALTEAELMAQLLEPMEFSAWLARFLPGLERGEPSTLLRPVRVSDATDGQIAHLHGLNLSRAWCFRRLIEALPSDDPRAAPMRRAVELHSEASLAQAAGSDYMVEHWLAAYATLLLT